MILISGNVHWNWAPQIRITIATVPVFTVYSIDNGGVYTERTGVHP